MTEPRTEAGRRLLDVPPRPADLWFERDLLTAVLAIEAEAAPLRAALLSIFDATPDRPDLRAIARAALTGATPAGSGE